MNLSLPPKSPALALHLAELLNALPSPSAKQWIDLRLTEDVGENVGSWFVPATNFTPAFYGAAGGGMTVILIAGCSTLTHSQNTIDGFRSHWLGPVAEPVNGYFQQLASAIKGELGNNGIMTGPAFLLAGHSLGGAVAEHIAHTLQETGSGDRVGLVTFGAPKPGGFAFAGELGELSAARWFTADDPVPLLPPTADLLPSLLLAHSPVELLRFQNYCHPAGGIEIGVDGELRKGVLPGAAVMNATASLAGWLLAVDGSSSSGHHLTTYQARLAYHLNLHPDTAPAAIEAGGREMPNPSTAKEETQQQKAVVEGLRLMSAAQQRGDLVIPAEERFGVTRAGRMWLVTLGGETIAASTRERSARRTARLGNEWLASVQRAPVVMPDELAAQFAEYVRKAQTAELGFRPVMNVRLPEQTS